MPLPPKRLRSSGTNSPVEQHEEIEQIYIKTEPDMMQYMSQQLGSSIAECSTKTVSRHATPAAIPANDYVAKQPGAGSSGQYQRRNMTNATPSSALASTSESALGSQPSSSTSCGYMQRSSSPTMEYDAAFLNFIKVNLALVTDVTLKDEITSKITMLLLEYKSKQRNLK